MHLKVSYEDQHDGITVVRVESERPDGGLDSASAPELREVLGKLVDDGRLILVVDLSAMDSVDYSGCTMLGGVFKRVHFKGGALLLVAPGKQARGMVSRVGLREVLRVHDTVSSAVAELAADYAQAGIEDRARRRRASAKAVVAAGDHTYEHLSEDITLVRVMGARPGGEVDGRAAGPLRKLMADLVNQGRCYLVMDLTDVDFIDSTGVGVFVGGLKRVRAFDGKVALVVSSEQVLKTFRVTGLIKVFPRFETADLAVEFIGRAASRAYVRP